MYNICNDEDWGLDFNCNIIPRFVTSVDMCERRMDTYHHLTIVSWNAVATNRLKLKNMYRSSRHPVSKEADPRRNWCQESRIKYIEPPESMDHHRIPLGCIAQHLFASQRRWIFWGRLQSLKCVSGGKTKQQKLSRTYTIYKQWTKWSDLSILFVDILLTVSSIWSPPNSYQPLAASNAWLLSWEMG